MIDLQRLSQTPVSEDKNKILAYGLVMRNQGAVSSMLAHVLDYGELQSTQPAPRVPFAALY